MGIVIASIIVVFYLIWFTPLPKDKKMSEKRKRAVLFTVPNRDPGSTGPHVKNGMFHQWGSEMWECSETGLHTHTIAIIEDPEGQIHQVDPKNVKFKD